MIRNAVIASVLALVLGPPHKIVEFELAGTRPFFLQLSNASADSVRLTITAAPARKL